VSWCRLRGWHNEVLVRGADEVGPGLGQLLAAAYRLSYRLAR
jgi:hypothetical protein